MSLENITIHCRRNLPPATTLDRLSHWLLLVDESHLKHLWRELPYGSLLKHRIAQRAETLTPGTPMLVELPNDNGSRVSLSIIGREIETFDLLTLARRLVALHIEHQPQEFGIVVHGFSDAAGERIAEAMLSAVLAAAAPMPSLKSKPIRKRALRAIEVFGTAPAHRFRRTRAELIGSSLARSLATLPSTVLTPAGYRKRIAELARKHGLRMEFMDMAALRRKRAGAFLAVAQGSARRDAGIVRLRYRPARGRSRAAVALVGKGICFDTGGVNVKPARFMLGMQGDMQGSAVALGTLIALAELKVPFAVEAWLALAMNDIGPNAYKPTDVVTASNGMTIEVIHTDAEGRMVLADTLALCAATKPSLIIDYATLTGACAAAIGKSYSGIFTNRTQWWLPLIENGRRSGERVWPFPLDKDFDKALESSIADVRQCAEEGPVDHILAARFLSRFVGESTPWIHLDLSSASNRDGLAHVPTHFNGFGVRYTLDLMLRQAIKF